MRIGIDAKRAFNNRSGLGNYSRDVIRSLSEKEGLDLYLYASDIKEDLFSSDEYTEKNNVRIIQPQDALNQTLKSYWRSFSIAKDVQQHQLDLFHGLSNEIPFTLGKMTKTVVTIHDLIFKRYPKWYGYIDRNIYDWKFKSACLNADRIIAISEQTKSDIVDFYKIDPNKVSLIYQTCNDAFKIKVGNQQKQKVREKYQLPDTFLLNVGTVEPRKNALEIVRALHQHQIDIPLVIIGRQTSYAKSIRDYIAEHQMEKQVLMFEGVSNLELPIFYQMAQIFVYPSTFEGFGIPIIEALYSGVPVISSTGGCFSEAGGEQSLYVDSGDIDALADAIKMVLNDSQKQNQMIEGGFEHAKLFDKERLTKELINLYQQTIQI